MTSWQIKLKTYFFKASDLEVVNETQIKHLPSAGLVHDSMLSRAWRLPGLIWLVLCCRENQDQPWLWWGPCSACLTVALWGCSRREDGRLSNWNSASHLLHDCLAALSGHVKLTEAVQQAGSCLFICPAWNGTHHKNVKKSHLCRLCIDIWSILKTLSDIPLPLKSVW